MRVTGPFLLLLASALAAQDDAPPAAPQLAGPAAQETAPPSPTTPPANAAEDVAPFEWIAPVTGGALVVGTVLGAALWRELILQPTCRGAHACWMNSPGRPGPELVAVSFAAYDTVLIAAGAAGGAAGGALDGDVGGGALAGVLAGSIAATAATVTGVVGLALGDAGTIDAFTFYVATATAASLGAAGGATTAHFLMHPVRFEREDFE